ncbi:act minimal PKS acyl carrier protein [Amycolatopsis pretoriensis]|uniref:Act minimal PKS acyl carrier protein n=1 Tax=Amycolatopsis pretoriensis TaxID=218821 RepID=A0A1H5QKB1_9PSEU|nr:acyl carrier protein [Amycolatopsis pretoriensis]SEF26516.1 act minimal PKS acyl carrier protein [Amycolatopsis pretoriensis]
MLEKAFTIEDLKRILAEGAGISENIDLSADILDIEFAMLGYDSLALLETAGRIEREYGISLDESILGDATTPRAFVDAVCASAG